MTALRRYLASLWWVYRHPEHGPDLWERTVGGSDVGTARRSRLTKAQPSRAKRGGVRAVSVGQADERERLWWQAIH